MYNRELYHYGIKGQKWGVRRYQYTDGTLTPTGKKRYSVNKDTNRIRRTASKLNMRVDDLMAQTRTRITGKQYADTYLDKGITFTRIQSSENFEKFAFFAAYEKRDSDQYLGLFGKNLISRANGAANRAERIAKSTGDKADIAAAKELRDKADKMKVYQLKMDAAKKLKVPSDDNASHITANLLKEPEFKKNVIASIEDSKTKMRRSSQQKIFRQAQNALTKDVDKLSKSEKIAIYKALNLTLTNHEPQEIAVQNRLYSELKKKGYNALLDYNDKEFSSYRAKRPMIVFDVDSVNFNSLKEVDYKKVDRLYKKYNARRTWSEMLR